MSTPDRFLFFLADSLTPAEGRQGLVGKISARGDQLFMHTNEISFTRCIELQNRLAIWSGCLRTFDAGHLGRTLAENFANRATRKLHEPCDAAQAVPLFMQLENRRSRAVVQHGPSPAQNVLPYNGSPPGTAEDSAPTPHVLFPRDFAALLDEAVGVPVALPSPTLRYRSEGFPRNWVVVEMPATPGRPSGKATGRPASVGV